LLDRFCAVVIVDILGMGRFAQVNDAICHLKKPHFHC
jgi:hypothetical protein